MPSRYDTVVDIDTPNNAHAFTLRMVGSNHRVLELGAASGYMTRALANQGCRITAIEYEPEAAADLKGPAEEVIVGDLNDPATLTGLPAEFDVVLAGDVLEHLIDPQVVLNRVTQLLAPGGRIVVSLPHIGHADVRLSLMQGRFDYHPWGLLDETHIRFFTLKTIHEMVKRCGLVITDLQRVRIPAFETELEVDRQAVSTAVLSEILADPEAETYQFIFTAVRDNGDYQTAHLASDLIELRAEFERAQIRHHTDSIQAAEQLAVVSEQVEGLRYQLACEQHARAIAEMSLAALRNTKTFRYTGMPRTIYGALRRAGR
jgi:2-polyprenyl-3-methyl-5-hydroxy-6-metoxy-1,4-benzoquinol methylase